MSEEKHEALSALVDGELSDEAGPLLVDQVLEDASLKRRWTAYHLIGDVMRKHRLDHWISDNDADAPRQVIAAPTAIETARRARPRTMQPLAGLALAASVAAVAVIGIYAVSSPQNPPLESASVETPGVSSETGAAGSAPATPSSAPQSVRRVIAAGAVGMDLARMTWNDAAPAVTHRLNGYLVTHNEYLSNGMRGMMPYARLVAYDDGRN